MVSIVIGSWGSYNECNERALGSKWIDLSDYESWEEIEEELKKQGFELNGIDEELFIQDVENFPSSYINWDYMNPKNFFELLQKAGVLQDEYRYKIMCAYIDVEGYSSFESRVNDREDDWDDDIYLYPNYDWYDLGYDLIHDIYGCSIPDGLDNYIDYKSYGESLRFDGFHEYDGGIIEIR